MKEYWLWYWGINQTDTSIQSEKKKFTDFNKMKKITIEEAIKKLG
jgi:hypothetical protein